MDVNGAQFYQVAGERGWADAVPALAATAPPDVSITGGDLQLHAETPIFPRAKRDQPLTPAARRGAARHENGWWYWIDESRTRLLRAREGQAPEIFWDQQTPVASPVDGAFHDEPGPNPTPIELAGLAVNVQQYLLVGDVSRGGVLIFDLTAGGSPLRATWPGSESTRAFDIAAVGDGIWILDRDHRTCWRLDRYFRVVSCEPAAPATPTAVAAGVFAPEGEAPAPAAGDEPPRPITLTGLTPIAIEAFIGDSVLVLGTPPPEDPAEGDASIIYIVGPDGAQSVLKELREVFEHAEGPDPLRPILGHDLVYDAKSDQIAVVERDGNQAIALRRVRSVANAPDRWELSPEFMPMHRHAGRGLIQVGGERWYDLTPIVPQGTSPEHVRWVRLGAIPQPKYARHAELAVTGPDIDQGDRAFDGQRPTCVWHRLFIDACIPPGTEVRVWARATDDLELLRDWRISGGDDAWSEQPQLYRRGMGAEIPLHRPFGREPGENEGTWELLFQRIVGRYAQIKLELSGNGRRTPRLRALRLYFPRISYPQRYLPAIYHGGVRTNECQELYSDMLDQAEPPPVSGASGDDFLERLLANAEGIYTDLESRIRAAEALVDPRSVPAEALGWLAGWVGITLDPVWSGLWAGNAGETSDRRRLVIRMARKLYERRGTPRGLRLALLLLLDPCLEALLARLERACVVDDPKLAARLGRLGLAAPTPATSDEELEDLFHDLLLDPDHPSPVRLIERFLTRGGRAVAAGDSSGAESAGGETDTAHRFSVLVPAGLKPDKLDMVGRLVELERPAHAAFEIKTYGEGFRIGLSRVGYETALGPTPTFRALMVGRDAPRDGYLSPSPPMDSDDRWITDRDGPGRRRPL